jgi:uncharacterized membrane-anchored protein YitT (DUF2179 family)
MQLEITETNTAARPRAAFLNVSWGAIFAGLAVGIASNMLLMMLGTAAGLSLFDLSETDTGQRFPLVAALWNTVSMIVAAFIGGYIAARASGLKRSFDGVLHAAVAWGMTLLLSAFLASSVTTATFDVMFPALQGSNVRDSAQLLGSLERGDRQEVTTTLQRTLGLSKEQADQLVDQALVLSGRPDAASAGGQAATQQTLRTATLVSIWLTASVALSLIAALGGGTAGVRGSRRVLHRRVTQFS